MPLEGQQLGRYRLIRLIDRGGMGEVYEAEDINVKRRVAIKMIRTEITSYADLNAVNDAVRLFRNEARAITMLEHPYILPLFDYGEKHIDRVIYTYMVMPYRQQGSLATWMRQYRKLGILSLQESAHFLRQAAEALQYAHEHAIIHRDVKPSNFLIVGTDKKPLGMPDVQLADFGVAKFMKAISTPSSIIRGTPMYMAPEQWKSEAVPATDQYALAVMVYELLVGYPPFSGNNQHQLLYQHMHEQPQPPSVFNPRIPPQIDNVLLQALFKEPEERYPSVSLFAQAFEHALTQSINPRIKLSSSEQAEENVSFATNAVLDRTVPAFNTNGDEASHDQKRGLSKNIFLLLGVAILVLGSSFTLFANFLIPHLGTTPSHLAGATHQAETATVQPNTTPTSATNATATNQPNLTATASSTSVTATVSAQNTATTFAANATATVSAQITATANALEATATAYNTIMNAGTPVVNDPLQDNSQNYNWDVTPIVGGGGCTFMDSAFYDSMPQVGYSSLCFARATDFANFTFQIEMTIIEGNQGGVSFRADATNGTFYYFHINRNGTYTLEIYSGNRPTGTILSTGSNPAILTNLGAKNVIGVVANGDKLQVFVNKHLVVSVSDGTYTHGQIGVAADAIDAPTEVVFSNVQIHTL